MQSEDVKEKKIVLPNTFEVLTCVSLSKMQVELNKVKKEIQYLNYQIDALLTKLEDTDHE